MADVSETVAEAVPAGVDDGARPTAREQAAFDRDGAVLMKGVVPSAWLGVIAGAIERDIAAPGPYVVGYRPEVGRFHGNQRVWENDQGFRAFCCEGPLRPLAAQLLGAQRLNLFYDQLFIKEPGTPQRTRWHNDQPYWPVRGWPVMSFWLPLDPVTRESGALAFVAGSHRWGRWFQPEPFAEGGAAYEPGEGFEPMPDIDAGEHRILSWDMEPGDALAFHALTVHGAGGNLRTDVRRRGYAVRYCGEGCTYFAGPGPNRDLRNPALADGAPLDSPQYPVVWP